MIENRANLQSSPTGCRSDQNHRLQQGVKKKRAPLCMDSYHLGVWSPPRKLCLHRQATGGAPTETHARGGRFETHRLHWIQAGARPSPVSLSVRPEEVVPMSSQIVGYYTSYKEKLLSEFGITCAVMQASLLARYGKALTKAIENEARRKYEKLVPEIPYIGGPRARALNTFLLISAQELAVYKALDKHGKSAGEVWELCHEALRLRLAEFPRWKRWLMRRFMFSCFVRKIMVRRVHRVISASRMGWQPRSPRKRLKCRTSLKGYVGRRPNSALRLSLPLSNVLMRPRQGHL